MRFSERIPKLKTWLENELCKGRLMKAPGKNFDISDIREQEPKCYVAWAPTRMDQSGSLVLQLPDSVVPGIIILPNQTYAKYMEEQRFDRANNVHRPQEMGQHLSVSILFGVYEPGVRLRGFAESVGENGKGLNLALIQEGTEQGFYTLIDWMEDCIAKLLGKKIIPGTDLYVEETLMTYSLYTDQNYVVDRRPIYYGFVNVSFGCYAEEAYNPELENLLN